MKKQTTKPALEADLLRDQVTAISELCDSFSEPEARPQLLAIAIQHLAQKLEVSACCIWQLKEQTAHLIAGTGLPAGLVGYFRAPVRLRTMFARVLTQKLAVMLPPQADDLHLGNLLASKRGAAVLIPGRPVPFGVLSVYAEAERQFMPDEMVFLQLVAQVLGMALTFDASEEARLLAETLYQLALTLNSTLELPEVLEHILDGVKHLVPFDSANVMLIESDHAWIARRTNLKDQIQGHFSISATPTLRYIRDTGEPLLISDTFTFPGWIKYRDDVRSYLGVPLFLRDQLTGFLNVNSADPANFTPEHADVLQIFGTQAALAIHNAQICQQVQDDAIAQERQRLARDLHDAVNHLLFTSSLMAQTALRKWGDTEEPVAVYLRELERLNRGALAEMRTILYELQPDSFETTSFRTLIGQLANAMTAHYPELSIDLDIDTHEALPINAKMALFRITQEALNNISKHAQATYVNITLKEQKKHRILIIRDN